MKQIKMSLEFLRLVSLKLSLISLEVAITLNMKESFLYEDPNLAVSILILRVTPAIVISTDGTFKNQQ